MPSLLSLPKSCATIRGVTDIRHDKSLGGETAKQANRLYMLTVRRESLLNKKRSLESRLMDIKNQVSRIESELRQINTKYRSGLCMRRRKRFVNKNEASTHSMALNY